MRQKQEKTQEAPEATPNKFWLVLVGIGAVWFIGIWMPNAILDLYHPIATSWVVRFWPVWFFGGWIALFKINDIKNPDLRARIGTPIAMWSALTCPIALNVAVPCLKHFIL